MSHTDVVHGCRTQMSYTDVVHFFLYTDIVHEDGSTADVLLLLSYHHFAWTCAIKLTP